MKQWLKPEIEESQAGMEVTSYLPAELDGTISRKARSPRSRDLKFV